jgi:hypothetical protein
MMTALLRAALHGRRGPRIAGALLGAAVAIVLLATMHVPGKPGEPWVHTTSSAGDRAAQAVPPFVGRVPPRPSALQTRADLAGEIDTLARIVHALGMRRIALCGAPEEAHGASRTAQSYVASRACAGDAAIADARAIAALEAQAVIFSGTAGDAANFVATLRADRSFAMVVLASPVDREAFARALPAQARTWIAVADANSDAGDAVPGARALTLAMLTPGAHAH